MKQTRKPITIILCKHNISNSLNLYRAESTYGDEFVIPTYP